MDPSQFELSSPLDAAHACRCRKLWHGTLGLQASTSSRRGNRREASERHVVLEAVAHKGGLFPTAPLPPQDRAARAVPPAKKPRPTIAPHLLRRGGHLFKSRLSITMNHIYSSTRPGVVA